MADALLGATLALALVGAVTVVALEDPPAFAVAFGAYGLALATAWAVLRAPDVALTEAAVGAGVTTALLLAVLRRTDALASVAEARTSLRVRPATALTAAGTALALGATVPALPAFGDPETPPFRRVVPFYLADAPRLGIDNVVTAILVVYRGFDTFGEIVVVFAAGVAAAVVLREVVA